MRAVVLLFAFPEYVHEKCIRAVARSEKVGFQGAAAYKHELKGSRLLPAGIWGVPKFPFVLARRLRRRVTMQK